MKQPVSPAAEIRDPGARVQQGTRRVKPGDCFR
jgi:hypothetical protein